MRRGLLAEGRALEEIAKQLEQAKAPAVAWTGGADSQVLLDLVRRVKPGVPLFWIRQDHRDRAAHRWHYEYLTRIGAEVYDTFPYAWSWLGDGADVDLLAFFRAGAQLLPVVFAVEPGFEQECVFDLTARTDPRQSHLPFDLLFCGQRTGDEDGWGNRVKLSEASQQLSGTRLAFPLRDWSRAMVLGYADMHGVELSPSPQVGQGARCCVRCLTGQGAKVVCPQTGETLETKVFDYAAQQTVWRDMMEQNNVTNVGRESAAHNAGGGGSL